jgi:hypothetical protein
MTFRHRQLFKLQLITVPGLPHMKLVGQLQWLMLGYSNNHISGFIETNTW